MPRSSWNIHSPDVVGVEFIGIGVANHIVATSTNWRALRFKPQRSGEVDQIAVYSGAGTSNPVLSASHFLGHRKPWIIDLIPASGFDVGGAKTTTTLLSNITTSSNCVDELGTAPEGNELAAANDDLFLISSGSPALTSATCEFPTASTFDLTRHVTDIALDVSFFKNTHVRRIDQNGNYLWTRQLTNGTWTMGEAYIEAGSTTPFRAWSPSDIRQFAASVGNRRIRTNAASAQINILDLVRLRVGSIPERRAGTAIFEPPGTFQWILMDFHAPNATGTPATVVAGQDYILLVRPPGGDTDYASAASYDFRAVGDRRPSSTFVHFTDLDWDLHSVTTYDSVSPRALGDIVDGLPAVRIINDGAQTVDTQPYQETVGVAPRKSTSVFTQCTQRLQVPAGTTEYGRIRLNVALLLGAVNAPPQPTAPLNVRLVNDLGSVIAGPVQVTQQVWEDSPQAGNDIFNDPYRTVTLDFGSGIDINEANGVVAQVHIDDSYPSTANNIWRIGCLLADIAPITGSDQTAVVSGTGLAAVPPVNTFVDVSSSIRRGDLLISILSQPPAITGVAITGAQQPVTGGTCDPCDDGNTTCEVTSIPYNHICWTPTTVTRDKFAYYEVQRQEQAVSLDWITVAIISSTGVGATGVAATDVPNCWDDWSHVYDSQVCYRVRQHRFDGTSSDFEAGSQACITTASPTAGDLIITAPDDPSLNVAFPEVHSGGLPIRHEWENLDAGQLTHRAIYGRDKFLAFRPLEKLGLRFSRDILIRALCTPQTPCLSVVDGLKSIASAPVSYLVVRDTCGNRWYASVAIPNFTQLHDPGLPGDIWLAAIEVTELATPVISIDD